jgi:hypothetical protein
MGIRGKRKGEGATGEGGVGRRGRGERAAKGEGVGAGRME